MTTNERPTVVLVHGAYMAAHHPGTCASCGVKFGIGTLIKAAGTYGAYASAGWVGECCWGES